MLMRYCFGKWHFWAVLESLLCPLPSCKQVKDAGENKGTLLMPEKRQCCFIMLFAHEEALLNYINYSIISEVC